MIQNTGYQLPLNLVKKDVTINGPRNTGIAATVFPKPKTKPCNSGAGTISM